MMKVHVFKVSLFHAKRIYRKIACLGEHSLGDLHEAIFSAYDRYDEHLYSFYFPLKPTQSMATLRRSTQYSHPMALTGMTYHEQLDATDVSIEALGLAKGRKFYYLFDYGDEWWHEVTYEGVQDGKEGEYPAVLLRKGESPDQYPEMNE